MTATRQRLHSLVDIVEETGLDTLYNVMIRFIPETEPLQDEIDAHIIAVKELRRGETVSVSDVNWD